MRKLIVPICIGLVVLRVVDQVMLMRRLASPPEFLQIVKGLLTPMAIVFSMAPVIVAIAVVLTRRLRTIAILGWLMMPTAFTVISLVNAGAARNPSILTTFVAVIVGLVVGLAYGAAERRFQNRPSNAPVAVN